MAYRPLRKASDRSNSTPSQRAVRSNRGGYQRRSIAEGPGPVSSFSAARLLAIQQLVRPVGPPARVISKDTAVRWLATVTPAMSGAVTHRLFQETYAKGRSAVTR